MPDRFVGTMKDARVVVPHRSNSVIQDWIDKGIVDASKSTGTGNPYEFTFYQLLDLAVVDQLAALGVFQKPYKGRNIGDPSVGEGNVYEVFEYLDTKDSNKIYPPKRSRKHAIAFYKAYNCRVVLTIYLLRKSPPLDRFVPIRQTKREASRSKVGALYYRINYFAEVAKLYEKEARITGDPYQIIKEEAATWRRGKMFEKGATMCMISVDRLRDYVQKKLGLLFEPVDRLKVDEEQTREWLEYEKSSMKSE